MKLYIIVDKQFPGWVAYEVHDGTKRVLYTKNWNEVIEVMGSITTEPVVVLVE